VRKIERARIRQLTEEIQWKAGKGAQFKKSRKTKHFNSISLFNPNKGVSLQIRKRQ
jgi:hypothetical protein